MQQGKDGKLKDSRSGASLDEEGNLVKGGKKIKGRGAAAIADKLKKAEKAQRNNLKKDPAEIMVQQLEQLKKISANTAVGF